MAKTAAQRNRAIRQEELRAKLAAGGHLNDVIEYVKQLAQLNEELEALEIQRLRAACDVKLKLVNKYLPDLKQTELVGESGGAIEINHTVEGLSFDKFLSSK